MDELCEENFSSVSAEKWKSRLWSHAVNAFRHEPYDAELGRGFWKCAYRGLNATYGGKSHAPLALGAEVLQRIWDRVRPDPARDLDEYLIWVQSLFGYHLTMRPNEHTDRQSRCVAGNVQWMCHRDGFRFIAYRFPVGSTKGDRLKGLLAEADEAHDLGRNEMAVAREDLGFAALPPTAPRRPVEGAGPRVTP